jgi:hypothetical protein
VATILVQRRPAPKEVIDLLEGRLGGGGQQVVLTIVGRV